MVAERSFAFGLVPGATVSRAQAGEERETEALIRLVWPHAYRIAYSILHDRGLAEDAAQEACAALFGAIRNLRSTDAFPAWFYRIVTREAFAVAKRRPPLAQAAGVPSAPAEPPYSDDAIVLREAMRKLSPRRRAIVALRYYAQLNSREIGRILLMPDATVRFHLATARRTLQHALREKCDDA